MNLRMPLSVTGISHKTAAVELRERVAFGGEEIPAALKSICRIPGTREAMLLSTCNRTEIVRKAENGRQDVLYWLEQQRDAPQALLATHSYHYTGREAMQHLARVACGMDSMVFGEAQILGQVKRSFAMARECGAAGSELHALFQHLFHIAKQVRRETRIGENAVTLASATLTLVRRLFTDLEERDIVFVGAGEIIEAIARRMADQGMSRLSILNRSVDRAREAAEKISAAPGALSEIKERLRRADVLVSCTGSMRPVIDAGMVRDAFRRRRRPLLAIDLAVPRDIEPAVRTLSDVYLYDVDHMRELVEQGARQRSAQAQHAEDIIAAGVGEYRRTVRARSADTLIATWRRQVEELKTRELARSRRQLEQGEEPSKVLKELAHTLGNKLMHAPTVGLRRAGAAGNSRLLAEARELLGIAAEDPEEGQ